MQAKRSDALRVFIMHHYGGLFLDLDVECYRAADDSFQQYDVVLQGTGDEGINNAVMASMPGKVQLHSRIALQPEQIGRLIVGLISRP